MATNSTLVRLNKEAYNVLHQLAATEELSMQEILSRALETYRREQFFERSRAALARLQADPAAWQSYQQESAELEGAVGDGLEDDEIPEAAHQVEVVR